MHEGMRMSPLHPDFDAPGAVLREAGKRRFPVSAHFSLRGGRH